MPYKPTGKPSGRPRKLVAGDAAEVDTAAAVTAPVEAAAAEIAGGEVVPAKVSLTRARAAFRREFPNPADELHNPPRYGVRRRHVGKRPILHPNVIAGGVK
jgi:hypothetical protein